MTKPQIIEQDGKPAFVILPFSEWQKLQALAEDASDQAAIDRYREGQESFPASVVDALLADDSPVRVFRTYRGLTQRALADACAITVPYLSQIEAGRRNPSLAVAKKLAVALGVSLDDLMR